MNFEARARELESLGDEVLRRNEELLTGGVLDPWTAYLLHRGLATLPVRMHAQQATAAALATSVAPSTSAAKRRRNTWRTGVRRMDPP